jgi:murein DD-endopeptidase MepM/ murein hydrolase activator NlpD
MPLHATSRPRPLAVLIAAVAVATIATGVAVRAEMTAVGGAATVSVAAERSEPVVQGLLFPMATSPTCLVFNNFGGQSGVYGAGGHQGVDIGSGLGQEVYAVESGVLHRQQTVELSGAAGNGWTLNADSNVQYRYYHLSAFAAGLAVGDRVQRGQVIGYTGDTGNATPGGYHLHFEVRPGLGAPVDPVPLLAIPRACTLYPRQ